MLAQIAHFAAEHPRLYIILSAAPYVLAGELLSWPLSILVMIAWTLYRCRICPPAMREQWDSVEHLAYDRGADDALNLVEYRLNH